MTYTPGVFDRTIADILARNSKAYLNIADWSRIYDNASYLNGQYAALYGSSCGPIPFTAIAVPTYSTQGAAADLNTLLTNIRNLWTVPGLTISGVVDIKIDWTGGISSLSPTYVDVNDWERDLDLLYEYIRYARRRPRTGVATAGMSLTRQNGFRP